jgi:hypothetical protein
MKNLLFNLTRRHVQGAAAPFSLIRIRQELQNVSGVGLQVIDPLIYNNEVRAAPKKY